MEQGRVPASRAAAGTASFAALARARYLLLTTYRQSGAGVATPVWFAREGQTLYVRTSMLLGKAKRIARTPRVMVAPCTVTGRVTGPAVAGSARLLTAAEAAAAERTLARKYGLLWWLYFRVYARLGRRRGAAPDAPAYLAIVPADASG